MSFDETAKTPFRRVCEALVLTDPAADGRLDHSC